MGEPPCRQDRACGQGYRHGEQCWQRPSGAHAVPEDCSADGTGYEHLDPPEHGCGGTDWSSLESPGVGEGPDNTETEYGPREWFRQQLQPRCRARDGSCAQCRSREGEARHRGQGQRTGPVVGSCGHRNNQEEPGHRERLETGWWWLRGLRSRGPGDSGERECDGEDRTGIAAPHGSPEEGPGQDHGDPQGAGQQRLHHEQREAAQRRQGRQPGHRVAGQTGQVGRMAKDGGAARPGRGGGLKYRSDPVSEHADQCRDEPDRH